MIALRAGDYDVHPDSQRPGAGRGQIYTVGPSFDAEREMRRRTANRSQVVEEDVDDVVERDAVATASAERRVRPAAVPAQRAVGPVEDEPAPVPGVQRTAAGHLAERALAGGGRQLDRGRVVFDAVAGRLDELSQVERRLAHRQVARERSTLAHTNRPWF